MNDEQQKAYEWAKNQNYPSVAAQYAKCLAGVIDRLTAELAESKKREQELLEKTMIIRRSEDSERMHVWLEADYSTMLRDPVEVARRLLYLIAKEELNRRVHGTQDEKGEAE